ncbi:MAG TPA: CaiB/BaiF CoA-transferase family protein [Steroidobacteraceae bacterium]|nr:CaiB/BaiF CoA-transferase family protein [Steroidobacteraceae bacterium]
MLPLEGVRILDLSRLAPGPYCTMLLGDLGADVLLIEEAGAGAARRQSASRLPDDASARERAAAFNALGRNKRSVGLNLKDEAARAIFDQLARDTDVVVEGFRPGVVKRLGVDYGRLAALNPRLIYCSLSGYGQTGPYAGLVGHDINYISVGGALGVTGRPGSPPAIPMNLVADFAAGGQQAALAIVVALFAREKTGRGQYLDVAMSDGVLSLMSSAASQYFASGVVPLPGEHLLNGGAPHYNVYETSDGGWISLGSLEPWFWGNLCRALGCEEFLADEYNRARYPEIFARFREVFKARTRAEWFALLSETDICVAPVYRLDEALNDPHSIARGMVVELEHPAAGIVRQVGIATKFSETPGAVRSTAPLPGRDTQSVLAALGYSVAQIAELRELGAIS